VDLTSRMGAEAAPATDAELTARSPDAILVIAEGGTILSANPACQALFGWPPAELIGQPIEILVPTRMAIRHVHNREGFAANPSTRPMGAGLDLRGRRRDGSEFPVDISLAPLASSESGVAAFVRDATAAWQARARAEALNEVQNVVLEGHEHDTILARVASGALRLMAGAVAWVSVRERGVDGDIVIRAVAGGDQVQELIGLRLPVEMSLAGRAISSGEPLTVEELDQASQPEQIRSLALGPAMFLPMIRAHDHLGALTLARLRGEPAFGPADLQVAEAFASSAAIVLAHALDRSALEELSVTADHERIARDLHDTVIQRVFGVGLLLAAARGMADDVLAQRIDRAVSDLDDIITSIRTTIFGLSRTAGAVRGVRSQIADVVADASRVLGFAPVMRMSGAIDTRLGEAIAAHVLAILREGLSNVARHAMAKRVEVDVILDDTVLTLVVCDDGRGIPTDGVPRGDGLTNIAERARSLGGELVVEPNEPTGTRLLVVATVS
jgi:PAS domain S-box-containing protein